jgi:hypothetical protein
LTLESTLTPSTFLRVRPTDSRYGSQPTWFASACHCSKYMRSTRGEVCLDGLSVCCPWWALIRLGWKLSSNIATGSQRAIW